MLFRLLLFMYVYVHRASKFMFSYYLRNFHIYGYLSSADCYYLCKYKLIDRQKVYFYIIAQTFNQSNPKPGHTTRASGRGARQEGGAGPGTTGRRQNNSPRKKRPPYPVRKLSKTHRLNVSPEARTGQIL